MRFHQIILLFAVLCCALDFVACEPKSKKEKAEKGEGTPDSTSAPTGPTGNDDTSTTTEVNANSPGKDDPSTSTPQDGRMDWGGPHGIYADDIISKFMKDGVTFYLVYFKDLDPSIASSSDWTAISASEEVSKESGGNYLMGSNCQSAAKGKFNQLNAECAKKDNCQSTFYNLVLAWGLLQGMSWENDQVMVTSCAIEMFTCIGGAASCGYDAAKVQVVADFGKSMWEGTSAKIVGKGKSIDAIQKAYQAFKGKGVGGGGGQGGGGSGSEPGGEPGVKPSVDPTEDPTAAPHKADKKGKKSE